MHKGGIRDVPPKYQLRHGGPRTPLGRLFRAYGYLALESVITGRIGHSKALLGLSQLRRLYEGGYNSETLSEALRSHGEAVGIGSDDLKWVPRSARRKDLRENHKGQQPLEVRRGAHD